MIVGEGKKNGGQPFSGLIQRKVNFAQSLGKTPKRNSRFYNLLCGFALGVGNTKWNVWKKRPRQKMKEEKQTSEEKPI